MATFHDSGSLPYVKHGTTNGLITFNPLTEHVYISVFFMIVYFRTENKKPDIAVPSPLIPFRPLQPHLPGGVNKVCKGSGLQAIRGPLGLGLGNSAPHNATLYLFVWM